jgi:hypothetical protein
MSYHAYRSRRSLHWSGGGADDRDVPETEDSKMCQQVARFPLSSQALTRTEYLLVNCDIQLAAVVVVVGVEHVIMRSLVH